jgi:flagellar hook-length control protein FliK
MLVDSCSSLQTGLRTSYSANQNRDREGAANSDTTRADDAAILSANFLAPELLKLTSTSPQTQALREERDRRDEEDRRRRTEAAGESDRQRSEQVAASVLAARPTQIIAEAERKMAPGSKAAQRQTQNELQNKTAQQRGEFQKSLAEAAARENQRGGASTDKPASKAAANQTGTQPARTDSAPKDAPSNVKLASAADSSKPAATSEPIQANATRPADAATGVVRGGPTAIAADSGRSPTLAIDRTTAAARGPDSRVTAADALAALRPVASTGAANVANTSKSAVASEVRPINGFSAAADSARGQNNKNAIATRNSTRAEPADPGQDDVNTEQIVRLVRSRIGPGRAEATLRLDPPELGIIRIHMDLREDQLSLRIEPQTALAHRLLSEQMESLRHGLESAGIQLEQVELRPPAGGEAQSSALSSFDTPQQAPADGSGRDPAGDASAEHSPSRGTESTPARAVDLPARESTLEPATESRVNILA